MDKRVIPFFEWILIGGTCVLATQAAAERGAALAAELRKSILQEKFQ